MKPVATLSLETLRQFGWTLWDPICLEATECPRDEYDTYLLELVSLLRHGAAMDEAVEYLIHAETETIGMRRRIDTRSRAERLAEAVEGYLEGLPAGPLDIG
jgi:uncharacterized protein YbgA (DUF1722 family)